MLLVATGAGALPVTNAEAQLPSILASFDPPLNDAGWAQGPVTVTLTCSDGREACDMLYRTAPEGDMVAYQGPFVLRAEGVHTIIASFPQDARTFEFPAGVDTADPEGSIFSSCSRDARTDACMDGLSYQLQATDETSGVARLECMINGLESACSGSIWDQGQYTLAVNATDHAGRWGLLEDTVFVDATPRVLDTGNRIAPGVDDGKTRLVFHFSETMDTTTTEGALEGASGWSSAWSADGRWLNLTAPDSLLEGTPVSITLGVGATDLQGTPLRWPETRTLVVRGPGDYVVTPTTYGFVDIRANGTDTGMYCDDHCSAYATADTVYCEGRDICGTGIEVPFGFTFYGRTYYELNISPNGFITLGRADCLWDYTPDPFPGTCHNLIAAYWEDLDTRLGTPGPDGQHGPRILTHTIGEAPSRVFIVSWSTVHHYHMRPPLATFQLQLHESTNVLEMHYESALHDGGDHLIGLINANGTRHTTYAFMPIDLVGTALRFSGSGQLGDTTPPTVSVSGSEGTIPGPDASIVFSFSEAMDRVETLAALEGADGWGMTWSEDSTVLTLSHDDVPYGTTTITLGERAADTHGVRIAAPVSRTIERVSPDETPQDTTPPTFELELSSEVPPAQPGLYRAAVTVSVASLSEEATLRGRVDGGEWSLAASLTVSSEGAHTVEFEATDSTGNVRSVETAFTIDTTAPSFALVLTSEVPPAESGLYRAPVTVTAGEASEAVTSRLRLGEGAWAPGSSLLVSTDGVHDVEVEATDAAGNVAARSVRFTLDTIAPDVIITLPAAAGRDGTYLVAPTAALSSSASDLAADGLSWSLDGATFTPGASAPLPEGRSTLHARAMDRAGNVASTTREVAVDTVAPHVASVTLTRAGPAATVVFAFSEPMHAASTLDAFSAPAGWTAMLAEDGRSLTATHPSIPTGTHTVALGTGASDIAGHPLAESSSTTVDGPPPPPPQVRVPEPPFALAVVLDGNLAQLGWSPPTSDNGAPVTAYRVYLDGALVAEQSGTRYTAGPLARGARYTLEVSAVNGAGEGARAQTHAVLPPISTLELSTGPDASGWHRSLPTASFATDPPGAIVLYDAGAGETAYASPFTMAEGETTLRWRASAGGVDEAPREQTVRVDATPPTIDSMSLSSATLLPGETLEIVVAASDAHSGLASLRANVGAASIGLARDADGFYRGSTAPATGTNEVTIVATDGAGHETRASAGSVVVAPRAEDATSEEPAEAGGAPGTGIGGGTPLDRSSLGGGSEASPSGEDQDESPGSNAPSTSAPVIDLGDDADTAVKGTLTIRVSDFPERERLRIVLISESGEETVLSEGEEVTAWDSTLVPDGIYTIEARLAPTPLAPGEIQVLSSHAGGETLASRRIAVRNEAAAPLAAATVVVGSVLIAAAAHAGLGAAASAGTSASASATGGFDPLGFAQEVAIDAGQDKLRDKTKDKAALDRRRRVRSWIAGLASLAFLAAFWALAEADAWTMRDWLVALPAVGAAAAVVTLLKFGAESGLAWITHARPRLRLWVAGTISLIVSSIVFRNPFGYPGFVEETDESEARSTWRMQGLRGLATIAGGISFMLPFLLLAPVLPWSFVSVGILIAATNAATTAMPFGPLPGRDVWRWNKPIAVLTALGGFALYVVFAAALVPLWALTLIASLGGLSFAGSLLYFRRKMGPRASAIRVPIARSVPVVDADPKPKLVQEQER